MNINHHLIILFKVATGSTISSPSLSNISVAKATTTSITTPTSSTINSVANSPVCTPTVSTAYIPGISRPRGRPPGSKNTNTKVNDPMRITSIPQLPCSNWQMISSLITMLLQPLSPATASLPNMDMITGFLDPSIRQTVINLLSAPPFMTQLSSYTDSSNSIAFIDNYLKVTNVQNITQAREGFISVLNRLAIALTPSSMLNTMNLQAKPLKADKGSVSIPKPSSSMTIFPVPSKPQSVTPTSSKSNINTPTLPSATITSASNAMKSGAATVISMSSGQLTITPRSSISITANPKPSSSIPKLQSPTSNTQKQSKTKPLKDRPQSLPREFQLDLPIRGLPESLSITPSASVFSPTKKTMPSPMSIDPHVINKPTKATKTQRKSSEASNKIATNKGNTSSIPPYASRNLDQQRIDLSKVSGMQDFYSQYQQYLKMQSSIKSTKSNVISNPSSPLIPQPKSTIKVKNLDQLISEPKQNPKSSRKAKLQTFPTPNMGMAKNQTMTNNNSALLNSYGTTISSLLQSPQKIQPSYAPIISSTANITSPIRFVLLQYFHLTRFKSIFIYFSVHQKRYNKN